MKKNLKTFNDRASLNIKYLNRYLFNIVYVNGIHKTSVKKFYILYTNMYINVSKNKITKKEKLNEKLSIPHFEICCIYECIYEYIYMYILITSMNFI